MPTLRDSGLTAIVSGALTLVCRSDLSDKTSSLGILQPNGGFVMVNPVYIGGGGRNL